uniref:TraA n=1 Tax=Myxococcus xanthus TaxID=34 RepID=A0A2Z4L170_MYXXA|nr:TraA [Myxococcus xanthus]AWX24320.1 TraA [Myxococcus xanthus]AWX24326.1 TraA [Myxococcus xanthus]AWX24346.1 TraA [Myxococcus xanthus]AWX24347.1 TraA [Myxococcus xanthus]
MGDIPHCCGALKSPVSRIARTALTVLAVCLAASTAWGQKLPDVVIQGPPIAPALAGDGQGLCVASNVWTRSLNEFPQTRGTYLDAINGYLEEPTSRQTRVTTVLRTQFDLSNNLNDGRTLSYGDFVGQETSTGCSTGGCSFNIIADNDAFTPAVSRFRGYLNVTAELAAQPLHFGFYADDAISMVVYDRSQPYTVINRPPQLGAPTWRTTNSVTFSQPGIYAVEMLYSQVTEHAALEMSMHTGAFADFERAANQPPVVNLFSSGFQLLRPAQFFQTENGILSFEGQPDRCEQCNRGNANQPGNGGCGSFFHCNAAALCAPCDSSLFCGEYCSPCGESAPHCANVNGRTQCVQCIEDGQCPNGRCDLATNQCTGCNEDSDCATGACDTETFTCVECNDDSQCTNGEVCATDLHECRECTQDSHCPQGESCTNNVCSPCATNDSCAGNSCNCCPNGTQCMALTPGATPTCVECTTSSQCAAGQQCDTANGRCVDSVPSCNTADSCGPGCVKCPGERPFCLDGEVCVQCRNDLECGDGQFCLSGECASCTTDKHCGPRCGACDGDTPFCLSNGTVQGSTCVGCTDDGDCGSGVCNPTTRTCENSGACAVTCEPGTVCDGTSCVECFADAHCPCGGTCDTATNTCSTACSDSGDCLGVEHCSAKTMECERGRRKPGTEPQGGAFCCGTTADATPAGSTTFLLLLAAGLTFLRRRRPAR